MDKAGGDIDRMIAIRQNIHQNAEGGFKEFKTREVLKQALISFGLEPECIKSCAKTGWVVDIKGTGPV